MQDSIALSSAEAELKASCKGVQEALGLRAALEFLDGKPLTLDHFTDASAAHAIIKRRGAGAIKHLTVRQLWLQEIMKQPECNSFKIPREINPADVLCSVGRVDTFRRHLIDLKFETPRSSEGGVQPNAWCLDERKCSVFISACELASATEVTVF